MKKISFVIPCYGSENTIENVVKEIIETIQASDNYEIILVNDNSPDNVWKKIQDLCEQDSKIKGILLAKNFGQHAALMAGYHYCTGDIIISLDDDGQTPANEMYKLVEELEKGYDVVYAYYPEKQHSKFRNFGSNINTVMAEKLINMPKRLKPSSYFAAKKFIIDEIIKYKNSYPYIGGLVFRSTSNIGNVAVQHRERKSGHSGYTLTKLLALWMNGFTAFSVKPLRIATIIGILCAGSGFIFGCITIIRKLLNPAIASGWSSTISILVFVGGIQMLMLGLIGEYIGRIYISLNNNPQYIIKKHLNIKE